MQEIDEAIYSATSHVISVYMIRQTCLPPAWKSALLLAYNQDDWYTHNYCPIDATEVYTCFLSGWITIEIVGQIEMLFQIDSSMDESIAMHGCSGILLNSSCS
jgi:hypothetical protein